MIAILLALARVAANRLDVPVSLSRHADVLPCGGNREHVETPAVSRIANGASARIPVREAASAAHAPDRQLVGPAVNHRAGPRELGLLPAGWPCENRATDPQRMDGIAATPCRSDCEVCSDVGGADLYDRIVHAR